MQKTSKIILNLEKHRPEALTHLQMANSTEVEKKRA